MTVTATAPESFTNGKGNTAAASRSRREPAAKPRDYGTPYPYWLKGKVKRIYR